MILFKDLIMDRLGRKNAGGFEMNLNENSQNKHSFDGVCRTHAGCSPCTCLCLAGVVWVRCQVQWNAEWCTLSEHADPGTHCTLRWNRFCTSGAAPASWWLNISYLGHWEKVRGCEKLVAQYLEVMMSEAQSLKELDPYDKYSAASGDEEETPVLLSHVPFKPETSSIRKMAGCSAFKEKQTQQLHLHKWLQLTTFTHLIHWVTVSVRSARMNLTLTSGSLLKWWVRQNEAAPTQGGD